LSSADVSELIISPMVTSSNLEQLSIGLARIGAELAPNWPFDWLLVKK